MLQLTPEGKWQTKKPDSVNDRKLHEIVQHLLASKLITGGHCCCSQCAAEKLKCGQEGGDKQSGSNNYVPIIMMPIYSTENNPFDDDCDVEAPEFKLDEKHFGPATGTRKPIPNSTENEKRKGLDDDGDQQKKIKRDFVQSPSDIW